MYFAHALAVAVAEHWKVTWEREVNLMVSLNNGSQYHNVEPARVLGLLHLGSSNLCPEEETSGVSKQ